ncbi:MAG: AAA family ATPase [Duncaniella sp.]
MSKILSDIRAEAATAAANAAQTAACNPPKKEKQAAVKPRPAPASRRPAITRMLSGSDWARHAAVTIDQKQLCGPLWYEGEICILFADTNVGKSILAVQIADMVANGMHCTTTLPELRPETLSQPVVYADFELSLVQFGRRYSCPHPDEPGRKVYYDFSQQFNRVELCYDMSSDDFTDDYATQAFADQVISDLEMRIEEAMARVLIIDNITFMASGTESAADAMPLMKKLVALKKRHDLSILLLAHTPKRALCNPLTRNDLQGSKMLINFADSAFAIGESNRGKDLRYIKQIKQRNCEQVYDRDNVLSCTIGKIYENFVGFSSIGTDSEDSHLAERQRFSRSRTDMRKVADEMKTSGKSIDEIASALGVSRSTTFRLLRKSEEECDPTP